MSNKFRSIDSNGRKYNIEKIPPVAEQNYSIKTAKGQYAEINFDGEKWTEKWNNSFVPKFEYDILEIGRLIQEHYDF